MVWLGGRPVFPFLRNYRGVKFLQWHLFNNALSYRKHERMFIKYFLVKILVMLNFHINFYQKWPYKKVAVNLTKKGCNSSSRTAPENSPNLIWIQDKLIGLSSQLNITNTKDKVEILVNFPVLYPFLCGLCHSSLTHIISSAKSKNN